MKTKRVSWIISVLVVAASCATSDVSWNETQAAKAASMKQIANGLAFPRKLADIVAGLGPPPLRSSQAFNDPSIRSSGDRSIQQGLARTFGYMTVLAYYTGPHEITRVLALGNVAVGKDTLTVPEIIWAEQGSWLPPSKAANLFPSAPVTAATGLGNPTITEEGAQTYYVWADEQANELIVGTSPRGTGHFSRIVTFRVDSVRQLRGRRDVLAAVASTVQNATMQIEA